MADAKGASMEVEDPEQNDLMNPEDERPGVSMANTLNGLLFIAGVVVVVISQFTTWLGGRMLSAAMAAVATILSTKHETWDNSFLVWCAIWFFEFIFVIAQFTCYRDHKIVKAISFWWIIQCSLQIAYFVLLMFDFGLPIWITAGMLIGNFVILMLIIGIVENSGKFTFLEFWCLRAPFSLHAGYLMCESIAWLNILLQVRSDNTEGVVIATSMTGVTAILTLTTVLAMAVPRPDFLFCAGVAYTYYWVASELYCENPAMPDTCYTNIRASANLGTDVVSDATLQAFQYAALSICFIAGCLTLLAFGLRVQGFCQRGRV